MRRFRILLFSALLAALPFSVSAQRTGSGNPNTYERDMHSHADQGFGAGPFMGMASPAQIDRSLKVLEDRLDLSASQTTRVRELVESRRGRFESIREEGRPKFRQLMSLLNKPNPDPYAVGQATIALKQVHDRARTEQSNLENDFLGVLNDTQRQTVNNLRREAPTVMALHRLGLLSAERSAEQETRVFGR